MVKPAPELGTEVWILEDCEAELGFVEAVRPLLMDWEEQRMDRFRRDEDRVRFAAAHGLVRWILSRSTRVPLADWRLEHSDLGRPYVVEPTEFRESLFSLSHTSGLLGCVVTCGRRVGLDIEAVLDELDVDDVLPLAFSADEIAKWWHSGSHDVAPPEGRVRFLRAWAFKEALAKGLGMGLHVPPQQLEFDLGDPRQPHLIGLPPEYGVPGAWQLDPGPPREGHVTALAIENERGQTVEVRWQTLESERLLRALLSGSLEGTDLLE